MPLVSGALVHFDETSIVGSTPVTELTNNGSGGSGYDLDVIIGTGANLTKTTVNGLDSVTSDGTVAIETTAGQMITGKTTVFAVIKLNSTSGGVQNFTNARSSAAAINALSVGSGTWRIFAGSTISFGTEDTDLHIWTAQFNQDTTSKLTVSDEGSVTGSAGSNSYDFGTFFANRSGADIGNAIICEYVLYNSELSAGDITQNETFLNTKWFVAAGGGLTDSRLALGLRLGIG